MGYSQIVQPVHHVIDSRGRDAYWLFLHKCQPELPIDTIGEPCLSPAPSIEDANKSSLTKPIDASVITDDQAVAAGYISLSPVRLHYTPETTLNRLSALVL